MVRLNGSTASSSGSECGSNKNSNKSKEQMDRGQKISHYCRSLIGCSVVVRQGRVGTRPERCQRPSLRALHGLRAELCFAQNKSWNSNFIAQKTLHFPATRFVLAVILDLTWMRLNDSIVLLPMNFGMS